METRFRTARDKEIMMKLSDDFRRIAREALRGRWPVAVLTGFAAALIGAAGGGGNSTRARISRSELDAFLHSGLWRRIMPLAVSVLALLAVWTLVTFVIGGAGRLGYAKFNLNLVDGREAKLSDLFSQFDRLWAGFCMRFLHTLYLCLWTLLFIVPGIVKGYSYAMSDYILAEHPEMTANEAITESRRVMDGNKWRLFCLHLSFIGWDLLCELPVLILTVSITVMNMLRGGADICALLWIIPLSIPLSAGRLFLRPYREAALAAFYRDISGTEEERPLGLCENNSADAGGDPRGSDRP